MATKTHIALLAAALSLSLVVPWSLGQRDVGLSEEQQCRFQHISSSQPSQRIESEGGTVELWEQWEDQFQCAGVQPLKYTVRPRGLSLPNYHPSPLLLFVEQGEGFLGVTFPGCAETFHSGQGQREEEYRGGEEEAAAGSRRDMHQKVHRIRKGDIIAIPVGAVHWCYNDGNQELVTVSIYDLNHQSNQLDQNFRSFFLAGGVRSGQQEQSRRAERRGEHEHELSEKFQNIFREFDTKLLAEAYNVPEQTIQQMQQGQEERGLIVTVRERMRFIRPDEEREQGEYSWGGRGRGQRDAVEAHNGLEESFCAMKIRTNIETRKETDVYSRQAGKVNIVDRHKLPILKFMDLSAERGSLYQNALLSPNWDAHGHTIVYVTKGEAQVQIVDHRGQAIMNDRVKRGDMFVVPQYYIATARAQQNGYEWVAFKTTGWPMRHSVSGYTSIFRAMPLEVVANAYQVSPVQSQRLKLGRGSQSFLLSPGSRQY